MLEQKRFEPRLSQQQMSDEDWTFLIVAWPSNDTNMGLGAIIMGMLVWEVQKYVLCRNDLHCCVFRIRE